MYLHNKQAGSVPSAVVVNVWGPFILFSLNTAGCASPDTDRLSVKQAHGILVAT